MNIFSNNTIIYSQNIKIEYRMYSSKEKIFVTLYNISVPLIIDLLYNSITTEKLYLENQVKNIFKELSYIKINVKRFIINNISILDPMISYKIMSINLFNQGYYMLADLFVLPKIQKISNRL